MHKDFFKKIRYIFLPFLFVSVGYIAFCTLFYWYFVLEKKLIRIDDEALFTVSILLCWLVVFIWVKPRFQLLKIKDNTAAGRQLTLIMCLILINPMVQIISKNNYETLALVNDISQLDEAEKNANCYEIKDYIIVRDIYRTYYKLNQLDDSFGVNLYCVAPMFSSVEYGGDQIKYLRQQDTLTSKEDTTKSLSFDEIKYWCCFSFYDSFRDRDDYRNQQNIDRFIKESKMEIPSKDFDSLSYFRILTKGKDYRNYKKALNKFDEFVPSNAVLLLGEEEPFGKRNINMERGVFWVSLVSLIGMILFIFIPAFNDEALSRFKMGKKPIESNEEINAENLIVPNKKIWVTQSIIYITLGIFLLMTLNNVPLIFPSWSEIRPFGTSYGNLISDGESWRFITALFVNGGAPILVYTIISFAFFGFYMEKILGHLGFLLIVLTIGIGTNMATYFINPDSHLFGFLYVVIGISAFLCILKLFKDKLFNNEDLLGIFILSGLILLMSVGISLFSIHSDFALATFISIGIGVLLGFIQFLLNRFS